MTSFYGSTKQKQAGINMQTTILQKIIKCFNNNGIEAESLPVSVYEDMNHKYDYHIKVNVSPPFMKGKKEIFIDGKYGKTFTLYDNNGKNTLNKSKSDYIVYIFPNEPNKLMWINTQALKESIKTNPPKLHDSFENGNISKFFWMDTYLKENITFLRQNGCYKINI